MMRFERREFIDTRLMTNDSRGSRLEGLSEME